MKHPTKPRERLPDYGDDTFWENIWVVIDQNAQGLTPSQIITAFRKASDDIWDAGLDAIYDKTLLKTKKVSGINFDIIWTSLLAVYLHKASLPK